MVALRHVRYRLILALLAVLMLSCGSPATHESTPDAAVVIYRYFPSSQIIASAPITTAQDVAEAYSRAMSLPPPTNQELHATWHCGLDDLSSGTEYVVRFTAHDFPVLALTQKEVCSESWYWTLSRSGQTDEVRSGRTLRFEFFVRSFLPLNAGGIDYAR